MDKLILFFKRGPLCLLLSAMLTIVFVSLSQRRGFLANGTHDAHDWMFFSLIALALFGVVYGIVASLRNRRTLQQAEQAILACSSLFVMAIFAALVFVGVLASGLVKL